ncbi:peptidylprolyl isomerase, partial [Spongiibacter sp.]
MSVAIGPGTEITLHFALLLEDGSEVDSTFERQAARFVFGDGNLLPGVEAKLQGLKAGD